jgi:hypothetical protein
VVRFWALRPIDTLSSDLSNSTHPKCQTSTIVLENTINLKILSIDHIYDYL